MKKGEGKGEGKGREREGRGSPPFNLRNRNWFSASTILMFLGCSARMLPDIVTTLVASRG